MSSALVVSDNGGIWRIVANESCGPICPASIRFNPLLNRSRRNEGCFLFEQIRSERSQWSDVINDPNAAAMCCKDEIIIAWLNCKVPDSDSGKTATLELRPCFTPID